jgi:hypothetical protein
VGVVLTASWEGIVSQIPGSGCDGNFNFLQILFALARQSRRSPILWSLEVAGAVGVLRKEH